jgi:type VI secretion system secreted protein VgrG
MTFSVQRIAHVLNTHFTQDSRLLRLTTPLGSDTLLAECFKGSEALSEGFKFELTALSLDADIALKTLIGQPVLLELLTAASRDELRPFHAHITGIECVGANGGLARYRLTLEPWTAFLRYRRDSTTYQDMSVFDILESVFSDYHGQGKLNPAWRFDILDPAIYPKRSLTTQYQETDFAFIERLMLEEGLFWWFAHQGDAASPSLGSHTLVIADHNGVFAPNAQAAIDFSQPGAVMKSDCIDRWRSERRWQTNAIELVSWDYRSIDPRPVAAHSAAASSADPLPLVSQDAPGIYAYENREQGQRIATNQLQALEASNKTFTGAGTVRTLAPATSFTLHGHPEHDRESSDDDRTFVILRAVHLAHNNLSAELQAQVGHCLGRSEEQDAAAPDDPGSRHAIGSSKGERPLYRNRIDAIRRHVPYRSLQADQHGRLLHPKPTVHGQQTAIVVGPAGQVLYTDRDHRIKVQFHWQRGNRSHSRLAHPSADGHSGAPASEQAGTWVRVATPLAPIAGANWGSHALPRIGQEVLVDFLEGDIDRPVVIGSLYNGRGQPDAQHNQLSQGAGVASGNAPAWFPGAKDGHAHAAVLSGIKTQSLPASQRGDGGYQQLVFDDSPGQSRTALQHHASAHRGTAELNLGALRHQTDNQRLAPLGFGAELKTEHSLALRAGQGLLLSTDARRNASGSQLDSSEAQAQLADSHQLQLSLAATAQQHHATLKDAHGQAEAMPEKLPAIAQLQRSLEVLKGTANGTDAGSHGGSDQVTAYTEPQLQLSSPAGIAATTPANMVFSAGASSSLSARHLNFASQGNTHHTIKAGISLFTYGKAGNKNQPNQETGIKLHAASGKVSSQSQSDATRISADKAVTVASIDQAIRIAAPKHVLLTAQGAYLKLNGGNIEVHGPGAVSFKAGMKELAGPASASLGSLSLPSGELELPTPVPIMRSVQWQAHSALDGTPMRTVPYELVHKGETVLTGRTSGAGQTDRHVAEQDFNEYEIWIGETGWAIGVEESDHGVPAPLDEQLYHLQDDEAQT